MNVVSYYSKLVGVSFEERQAVLAELKSVIDKGGDVELRFRREPAHEYDTDAVAVDSRMSIDSGSTKSEWSQVGYIARDNNTELARSLDAGRAASIKLTEVTGGTATAKGKKKALGINVYIEYEKLATHSVEPSKGSLEKDIFGNEIFYDDASHKYTNALGEVYLSGSKYADQFEKPFPKEYISNAMAKKNGLGKSAAKEIQDMWELKALASASYGTAIHAALELYGRFKQLSESVGKETHLHDNTVLGAAVKAFYDEYPDVSNVEYECLVVDHARKRAGRIDRLEYDEDGVWIADFKTNTDINKSLKKYWLQLSFYAAILKANGLKVKGLRIYHYDGLKWYTIRGKVIDIDKEKKL